MKGYLALDIDGTLTDHHDHIPKVVINHLNKLNQKGWEIIVLTGRSYPFALSMLEDIPFDFILSTQNGSCAFQMPSKKPLFQNYLNKENVFCINEIALKDDITIGAYADDFQIYWSIREKDKTYVEALTKKHQQNLKTFEKSLEKENFTLIKCCGLKEDLLKLNEKIEKKASFEFCIIKDPFHEKNHLLLYTQKGVSKGCCIKKLIPQNKKIICAGNDDNDLSMFEVADVKIAMEGSAKCLLDKADVLAPHPKDFGIIKGLTEAIDIIEKSNVKEAVLENI